LLEDLHTCPSFLNAGASLVTKRKKAFPRLRKARRLPRSPLSRKDVTRGEYNRIIDLLNQRTAILNEFRDVITGLEHASDIQFRRIAQLQADLDAIRRTLDRNR